MSGSERCRAVMAAVNAMVAVVSGLLSIVTLVMGGWAMLIFLVTLPLCAYSGVCWFALRHPERPGVAGLALFAIILGFALIAWFIHFMEGARADWDWTLMGFPALNSICLLLQLRAVRRGKMRGISTASAVAADCDGMKRP